MTATEILTSARAYMWTLANRAARRFGDDPADWFQDIALEVTKFAHFYDPARGCVSNWVHMRWVTLMSRRPSALRYRRMCNVVRADDPNHMAATTIDPRAADPADVALVKDFAEAVRRELRSGRFRRTAAAVVTGRFGLDGGGERTAGEIARELGLREVSVYTSQRSAGKKLAQRFAEE